MCILEVDTVNSSSGDGRRTTYARVRAYSDPREGWVRRSHLAVAAEQCIESDASQGGYLAASAGRGHGPRLRLLADRVQTAGSITIRDAIALYGCRSRSARSNLIAAMRRNLPGARLVQVAARASPHDLVRRGQEHVRKQGAIACLL